MHRFILIICAATFACATAALFYAGPQLISFGGSNGKLIGILLILIWFASVTAAAMTLSAQTQLQSEPRYRRIQQTRPLFERMSEAKLNELGTDVPPLEIQGLRYQEQAELYRRRRYRDASNVSR